MLDRLKTILAAGAVALVASCGGSDDHPPPGNLAEVATANGFMALVAASTKAGLVPALRVSGGGSDSNTLNEKGLRCLNLAIGMKEIHTVREHIAVDDLTRTCRIALKLITG